MRPIRALVGLVGFVFIASACSVAGATIIYVDDDAPPGGNGLSWPTAFTYLQDALSAAQPGDQIRVAQGTYYPDRDATRPTGTGDRSASFSLKNYVAVVGGYGGSGAPDPDERKLARYVTILSGDIGAPGNSSDNSMHVVRGGGTGATALLDGFTITAGNATGSAPENAGGGIYCSDSSPTLANCTITGNMADAGGGVCCSSNGSPTLINCTIMGNTADRGGGVYFSNHSIATLTHCTVAGNVATSLGGGLNCSNYSSPYLTNCIIWANTPEAIYAEPAITNPVVTYCDVEGGCDGLGNINADPMFAFPNDPYLLSGSPCIDAGTNSPPGGLPGADPDGQVRPLDGDGDGSTVADMGVHEFAPAVPTLALCATELTITTSTGQTESLILGIRNSTLSMLAWGVQSGAYWLTADPVAGESTGELDTVTLTANAAGLGHGTYTTTVCVNAGQAFNAPRIVTVVLHVKATLYVPTEYPTVQAAIDATTLPGDEVVIADGVYTGAGNRDLDFHGRAIVVRSASRNPAACILDCEDAGRGFCFHNGEPAGTIVQGLTIQNGYANSGGAVCCYNYSSPTLDHCVILASTADYEGGGVHCYDSSDPRLVNCMLVGNRANYYGGAVSCEHSLGPTLTNCTIVGNTAIYGGAVSSSYYASPTLTNCILWANTSQAIYVEWNSPVVTYCDVQSGHAGTGNIDADPLFVRNPTPGPDDQWGTPDDDFGDLHLMHHSVCIDAGNNAAVSAAVTTDLDGNPRFIDVACRPDTGSGTPPVVDMGAYEALDDVLIDCNGNGVDDLCDVFSGTSADCNANVIPDECDIAAGSSTDCNSNIVPDECDVASGASPDCNHNLMPDECDIGNGASTDCNANGIPDECDLRAALLFTFDEDPGWTTEGLWAFGQPVGAGSYPRDPTAGHTGSNVYGYNLNGDYTNNMPVYRLTSAAISCAGVRNVELRFWRWLGVDWGHSDWAEVQVSRDRTHWTSVWDNTSTGIQDTTWTLQSFDISSAADDQGTVYIRWVLGPTDSYGTRPGWNIDDVEIAFTRDCNLNNLLDECDILNGTSADCNGNVIPDECDLAGNHSQDCNSNTLPDECDIASGTSADCNANSIPDECDIASATSLDCDHTGVPDECEYQPDCNGNGISDACELGTPGHTDCNNNGVLDECDVVWGPSPDCNGNGLPDECDIADGSSLDNNANGIPDECEACYGDLNCDAVVDFADINAFVLYLSNFPVWQTTYVDCDAANGDIDANGAYPSFGDINPFVTLLSTSSLPLPCGQR